MIAEEGQDIAAAPGAFWSHAGDEQAGRLLHLRRIHGAALDVEAGDVAEPREDVG